MNRLYDGIQWTGNPDIDSLLARHRWLEKARPNQIPNLQAAYGYLLLAGRGFGKSQVLSTTGFQIACESPGIRIAVICRTGSDARGTMWSGDSGLVNNIPPSCIKSVTFKPLEIQLWNGSAFYGFSAEEPTGIRGPQFGASLLDEVAFWSKLGEGMECPYNMVKIATRLPTSLKTKMVVATTPDDVPLLYDLVADKKRWITVSGSTFQNIENLDATYIEDTIPDLIAKSGTAMAEMEIEGILRPRDESTVFKRQWFNMWPKSKKFPRFSMILESLDTAFSERTAADHSASSLWGVFNDPEWGGLGLILLGCWKEHLSYPDLKAKVLEDFHTGHGPEGKLFVSTFLVEWKGSGISLTQEIQATTSIPIQGCMPIGKAGMNDKVTRATLVSHLVEKGHVWIPEDEYDAGEIADYAKPFLDEVCRFSTSRRALKGQSDDWTDTFTQVLRWITDNGVGREPLDVTTRNRLISENTPRQFVNPYLR